MSRRSLLAGGLGVLAAGTVPSVLRSVVRDPADEDRLVRRLRALVDGAGTRQLGRAVLPDLPAGASARGLARGVLRGRSGGEMATAASDEMAMAASDEDLVSLLDAAVTADLRGGRLWPVQGWLLTATEARLAALTVVQR